MTQQQTAAQRSAARRADNASAGTLRVVQAIESCEERWLSDAPADAERSNTIDYLAGMASYLRFARSLYQDGVLESHHLGMLRQAAQRVVVYADERLDMLRG